MTSTDRKVTRVTTKSYPAKTGVSGRGYGPSRPISVTIAPGDILILRPKGTRQRVYIAIDTVYRFAVTSEARSKAMQKINVKRRKA